MMLRRSIMPRYRYHTTGTLQVKPPSSNGFRMAAHNALPQGAVTREEMLHRMQIEPWWAAGGGHPVYNRWPSKPLPSIEPQEEQSNWHVRSYMPENDAFYETTHRIAIKNTPNPTSSRAIVSKLLSSWITFVLVLLAFAILIIFCGGVWLKSLCGDYCNGERAYGNMLWLAWGFFITLSSHANVDSNEPAGMLVMSAFVSICGFVWTLFLFGLVVQFVRSMGAKLHLEHRCIICRDHFVILGWSLRTIFLLGELAQKLSESKSRGGTIVVLGDEDEWRMRKVLLIAYPDWKSRWPRVRVRFWHAAPNDMNAMSRVSIKSAATVFVMGSSMQEQLPRTSDAKLITRLFAMNSLPAPEALSSATTVVAELSLRQNYFAASRLGSISPRAPNERLLILPVEVNSVASDALALFALEPLVGRVTADLIDFDGNQFEILPARPFAPATALFGDLQQRLQGVVVVGIYQRGGNVPGLKLAPRASSSVQPEDDLLVIARDKESLSDPELLGDKKKWWCRRRKRVKPDHSSTGGVVGSHTKSLASSKQMPSMGGLPVDMLGTAPDNDGNWRALDRVQAGVKTIVILGWHSSMGALLRSLDSRLVKGSSVYILSEMSLHNRAESLLFEGVAVLPDGFSRGLPNMSVHQVLGAPLSYAAISRLPIESADCAIVVGDTEGKPEDQTDSDVVATTLLVQQLRLYLRRAAISRGVAPPPPFTIVPQFLSMNSARLLKSHPDALRIAPLVYRHAITEEKVVDDAVQVIPFPRNRVAASAIAAAGHSSVTWEATAQLLMPSSTVDMVVLKVGDVVAPTQRGVLPFASFEELRVQLHRHALGTLIGWRRSATQDSPGSGSPNEPPRLEPVHTPEHEINPPNKAEKLKWKPSDELIVIRHVSWVPGGAKA
ncbi:hypothetical protein AB1Y20_001573 [Prymnesium parvum]|uniref:Ion channel DMI1 n=1 Tax=Prymnesium parvum TaxID=97485 RepID=A0AB34K866_PRYPA